MLKNEQIQEMISERYSELKWETGDPYLNLREKEHIYQKAKNEIETKLKL